MDVYACIWSDDFFLTPRFPDAAFVSQTQLIAVQANVIADTSIKYPANTDHLRARLRTMLFGTLSKVGVVFVRLWCCLDFECVH
jgi:hypothetical protein